MENHSETSPTFYFLSGGGEMGRLMREKEWSKTPVGDPATWAQSLRTAVSILLSSRFPMFLWWGTELIQFYNDAYRTSLGNNGKHPSALGQKGKDCWQEVWEVIFPLIEQVLHTGEATWSENQLLPIYRNGKLENVYWTFSYSPVRDDEGKIEGVLVLCHETTKQVAELNGRKAAEEILKQRENTLRDLTETVPAIIWITDAKGYCTYLNKQWYEYTGQTKAEAEGFGWLDATHPDFKEETGKIFIHANEKQIPFFAVYQLRDRNGNYRWAIDKGSPKFAKDGLYEGMIGTVIDIHDQKLAEVEKELSYQKLAENELRFREMTNGLPLVVWTASPDGNLTYISDQWEEYYGNPAKESLGTGWTNYVHPEDKEDAGRLWLQSLQSGSTYETEFRVQHKSGQYQWILVRAIAVRNANNEIISWNGSNTDIQDKKLKEEALKESELKFRAMADNIPNLAWMANADGWIYWYNKQWYEYTGSTAEQMEGWGWQSVHDPDLLPQVLEKWKYSISNGIQFEMVFPIKAANNEFRQFLTRVLPVKDADGKIVQWFGTNTDITERIEAEKRLRESELRFQGAVQAVEGVIWTNNAHGEMKGEQAGWGSLTGQSYAEYQGYGWASAVHPDDRQPSIVAWNEAVAQKKTFVFEHRVKVKNGDYHFFSIRAIPLLNPDQTIQQWVGVHTNISERKSIEDATKESEQNLRNTILQAPVAMCIFKGHNHVVTLANARMFELWGKAAEQVMHKPIFEGLPEVIGQGFDVLLDRVYTTGETFSAQGVPVSLPRNRKVETVYVNFVYEAYRESDGTISGVVAVAVDVTPQVIAHNKIEEVVAERTRELAKVNDTLQKSNSELAQFAYVTSHDLQEPLRKITTFAERLEISLSDKLDDRSKVFLTKINKSTLRMSLLIRDVLTYSQLIRQHDLLKEVDLNQIIESTLSDYDLLIEQTKATINCAQLPAIEAIPFQMSQLFGNIIGNALKFAKKDIPLLLTITSSPLSAEVIQSSSLNPELDYWLIHFKDNGIGFNEEYVEQIFHIFQRLHLRSEYEGTGIGLALCKKIALNHNGDINAKGSSEEGAVFNLILPVSQNKKS